MRATDVKEGYIYYYKYYYTLKSIRIICKKKYEYYFEDEKGCTRAYDNIVSEIRPTFLQRLKELINNKE